MTARAYLDWNATAPVHPAAKAAVVAALELVGNPSSIHGEGRAARAMIEGARAEVAALVGVEAENVVFTSGATEAANAIFRAGLSGCCGKDIAGALRPMVGATEHAAVIAAAGPEAAVIPVDAEGIVDRDALRAMLVAGGPALVAIQLANNETGVVPHIRSMAEIVHEVGGALVVDAVQGPCKLFYPLAYELGDADAVFLSAHKFGGPKGVGALCFRDSRTKLAEAFVRGGGQERGQRGGTENLPGIAGMGAAARFAREFETDFITIEPMAQLREEFENRLNQLAGDVVILSKGAPRLANTTCFAIPGLEAAKALIAFDLDGVAVSSGSACSSGKVKRSHALAAMGVPDWVQAGAIRVSIGPTTIWAELQRCLSSLERQLARRSKASAA